MTETTSRRPQTVAQFMTQIAENTRANKQRPDMTNISGAGIIEILGEYSEGDGINSGRRVVVLQFDKSGKMLIMMHVEKQTQKMIKAENTGGEIDASSIVLVYHSDTMRLIAGQKGDKVGQILGISQDWANFRPGGIYSKRNAIFLTWLLNSYGPTSNVITYGIQQKNTAEAGKIYFVYSFDSFTSAVFTRDGHFFHMPTNCLPICEVYDFDNTITQEQHEQIKIKGGEQFAEQFGRKFLQIRRDYVDEFYGVTIDEDTPESCAVESCIRQSKNGIKFSIHVISSAMTFKDQKDRKIFATGLLNYINKSAENFGPLSFVFDRSAYDRGHMMRLVGQSKITEQGNPMRVVYGSRLFHQLEKNQTATIFNAYTEEEKETKELGTFYIDPVEWYDADNYAHQFDEEKALKFLKKQRNAIELRDWLPTCVLIIYIGHVKGKDLADTIQTLKNFSAMAKGCKNKSGREVCTDHTKNMKFYAKYMEKTAGKAETLKYIFKNISRLQKIGAVGQELAQLCRYVRAYININDAKKYVRTNIEQKKAADFEINKKFVKLEDIDEYTRKKPADLVFLESATGSGKSTMLVSEIQRQIKNDRNASFLYVLNSVQLCGQVFQQFKQIEGADFQLYNDEEAQRSNKFNQFYIICINSLRKIKPEHYYDYIIFDEVTNCVEQIKSMQRLKFANYREHATALLSKCRRAYFVQAHISTEVFDFFSDVNRDSIFIRNTYQNSTHITITNDPNKLAEYMRQLKSKQITPIITTDTDNDANIQKIARGIFSGFDMISRATLQVTEDVQERIKSDLSAGIVPICSPVISTGVDLKIPGTVTIGIYNISAQTLSGETMRQQITRNREASEIFAYINEKTPKKIERSELIRQQFQKLQTYAINDKDGPTLRYNQATGRLEIKYTQEITKAAEIQAEQETKRRYNFYHFSDHIRTQFAAPIFQILDPIQLQKARESMNLIRKTNAAQHRSETNTAIRETLEKLKKMKETNPESFRFVTLQEIHGKQPTEQVPQLYQKKILLDYQNLAQDLHKYEAYRSHALRLLDCGGLDFFKNLRKDLKHAGQFFHFSSYAIATMIAKKMSAPPQKQITNIIYKAAQYSGEFITVAKYFSDNIPEFFRKITTIGEQKNAFDEISKIQKIKKPKKGGTTQVITPEEFGRLWKITRGTSELLRQIWGTNMARVSIFRVIYQDGAEYGIEKIDDIKKANQGDTLEIYFEISQKTGEVIILPQQSRIQAADFINSLNWHL